MQTKHLLDKCTTYTHMDVTSWWNAICPTAAFGRWGHKNVVSFCKLLAVFSVNNILLTSFQLHLYNNKVIDKKRSINLLIIIIFCNTLAVYTTVKVLEILKCNNNQLRCREGKHQLEERKRKRTSNERERDASNLWFVKKWDYHLKMLCNTDKSLRQKKYGIKCLKF